MVIEQWIAAQAQDDRKLLDELDRGLWIPSDDEATALHRLRPSVESLMVLAIDLDVADGAGRLLDRIDDMLHEYDEEQAERDAIDDDERWPERPCGIGGLDR